MPKLRETEQEKELKILKANVKYHQSIYGSEPDKYGLLIQKSRATFYNRLNRPDTFTIGELQKLANKYHTTIKDLLTPKEKENANKTI